MDKEKEIKNKPLTFKELKSLKVGDWVWLIDKKENSSQYAYVAQVCSENGLRKVCQYNDVYKWDKNHRFVYEYSNYGTEWLAYKNKEEAENAGYGNAKQAVKEFAEKVKTLYPLPVRDDKELERYMRYRQEIDNLIKELCGD